MISDTSFGLDDQILAVLREARIISRSQSARLQRYALNFDRKDTRRKTTYRVWVAGKTAFHLTVGSSLRKLNQLAVTFAKANPEIACKPLFFIKQHDTEFFGQEYFGETNLEEGLAGRKIDETTWRNAVVFIQTKLAATARHSTLPRLLHELSLFEQRMLAIEWFDHFDQTFIHEAIFPLIRQGVAQASPRLQWTNGDFIAKNILFDDRGGYRLIDYEFAAETHFADIDWFRLQRFSVIPPSGDVSTLSGITARPKWSELLCWLQHALRLSEVCTPCVLGKNLQIVADNLTGLLASESTFAHRSLFIGAMGREFHQAKNHLSDPVVSGLGLEWSRTGSFKHLVKNSQPLRNQAWNELCFTLNPSEGRTLLAKFSLPATPATLDIRAIELRATVDDSLIWSAKGTELVSVLCVDGNAVQLASAEGVRIIHFGQETGLSLPLLDLGQYRDALRLYLWLHYTPSVGEFSQQLRQAIENGQPAIAFQGLALGESNLDKSATPATSQVFFPINAAYSEVNSVHMPLLVSGAWNELSFELPALTVSSILRFDPTNRPGLLEIADIQLEASPDKSTAGHKIPLYNAQEGNPSLSVGGDCIALKDTPSSRFLIFGNDPILYLPPLPESVAGQAIRLSVNLRFSPQVPSSVWVDAFAHKRQLSLQTFKNQEKDEAQKQSAILSERVSAYENDLQKISALLELGRGQEIVLRATLHDTQAANSTLTTELTAAQTQLAAHAAELAQAKASHSTVSGDLARTLTELTAAQTQLAAHGAELAQAKASHSTVSGDLARTLTELTAAQTQLAAHGAELAQAKASHSTVSGDLARTLTELTAAQTQLAAHGAELAQAKASHSTVSGDLARTLTELTATQTQLAAHEAELAQAKASHSTVSGDLARTLTELTATQTQLAAHEAELNRARAALSEAQTNHINFTADLVQAKELAQTRLTEITAEASLLEDALSQLRSHHQSVLESLHAQNTVIHNFKQRSGYVTKEIQELEKRLEQAAETEQKLTAKLTSAQERLAEAELAVGSEAIARNRLESDHREALGTLANIQVELLRNQEQLQQTQTELDTKAVAVTNLTAQLIMAKTNAGAESVIRSQLEMELANLHQRLLVRFDSALRRKKLPPTHAGQPKGGP